MTTYPLPTLAFTIDATGINAPSYPDILASMQASFRSIYGSDVYLGSDSQDGALLALFAAAINDVNAGAIVAFNAFSPNGAQGAGLSANVKINGLTREGAAPSTVDVTIVGTAGTIITNGQVGDTSQGVWNLPSTVTIPVGASIIVTAAAATGGMQAASAGTVTRILTPTRGWQSVTNVLAATGGTNVETDSALRLRQAASTALPALTPLSAISAAVGNVSGVARFVAYENDTGATDGNGVPAHSISYVVDGGDATAVATAIASKKSPGTGTYGTTAITVTDSMGVPDTIRFYRPTPVRILAEIDITALPGYVATTGTAMVAAVAAYVSGLTIGGDVYQTKVIGVADLPGDSRGGTFNIKAVKLSRSPAAVTPADVVIAFNEAATLAVSDIVLVVS